MAGNGMLLNEIDICRYFLSEKVLTHALLLYIGYKHRLQRAVWVPLLTNFINLGKLLTYFVPQFPHSLHKPKASSADIQNRKCT